MFLIVFIASGAATHLNDAHGSGDRHPSRHEHLGIRATSAFLFWATFPQVPIDDPKMYPNYATCVELGIPIFVPAGVRVRESPSNRRRSAHPHRDVRLPRPGVRHPPRLRAVGGPRGQAERPSGPTRTHSTSAFAPQYYLKAIVDYANSRRGADKVLTLVLPTGPSTCSGTSGALPNVPLEARGVAEFLYGNAARILGLEG